MAETANIAKMAEFLSKEIFYEFFWEKIGPMNYSWECVSDEHKANKHSSDIVFAYNEPYFDSCTYINTDLKSYAKGSITISGIRNAIENLILSTQCAQISQEWQKLYLSPGKNSEIFSLLFVYNHDGDYDGNFNVLFEEATKEPLNIPAENKLFVFGPKDVCYLNTIIHDIKISRADKIIPDREKCCFYFPDMINRKVVHDNWKLPATIDMLSGPWQILKYKTNDKNSDEYGVIFYCRNTGEKYEEFLYIIDYLFHYQLVQNAKEIAFRLPNAHSHASAMFQKAMKEYGTISGDADAFKERLKCITYKPVTNIITKFSDIEIGMREDD